jgi:hypothetical protein
MPELMVDFITSLDGYGAVITGSTGRGRIYDGYPDVSLDMIGSRTFDGRLQLVEYRPTVLAGPPGTSRADAEM